MRVVRPTSAGYFGYLRKAVGCWNLHSWISRIRSVFPVRKQRYGTGPLYEAFYTQYL